MIFLVFWAWFKNLSNFSEISADVLQFFCSIFKVLVGIS